MNKIFLLNVCALLACIAVQQIVTCGDTGSVRPGVIVGSNGGLHKLEAFCCFAAISLLVPAFAFYSSNNLADRKKQAIALLICNPILFGLIGFMNARGVHQWTISELMGPRSVVIVGPDSYARNGILEYFRGITAPYGAGGG